MILPVADAWFALDRLDNNILRLRERSIDAYLAGNIWLVPGSDRCAVIDTGTGMLSPFSAIHDIVRLPLMAIACNAWYDHAGGWHFFPERACHAQDVALITNPTLESSAISTYCKPDMFNALPYSGFDLANYQMRGSTPTVVLDNGAIIDLGGRQLEVIHAPGMTPGSIVLWEAASGSLFTSDLFYDDPCEDSRADEASPPTYDEHHHLTSLRRVRELPVVTVYPGHFEPFGRERMLQIIDAYLGAD